MKLSFPLSSWNPIRSPINQKIKKKLQNGLQQIKKKKVLITGWKVKSELLEEFCGEISRLRNLLMRKTFYLLSCSLHWFLISVLHFMRWLIIYYTFNFSYCLAPILVGIYCIFFHLFLVHGQRILSYRRQPLSTASAVADRPFFLLLAGYICAGGLRCTQVRASTSPTCCMNAIIRFHTCQMKNAIYYKYNFIIYIYKIFCSLRGKDLPLFYNWNCIINMLQIYNFIIRN